MRGGSAESRAEELVMRVAALVGLLLVLLFAGCASAQPASQLPKKDSIAPELTKQEASPRLDLTSLEKRLNETQAIDVLDKIAFRNQVDDLLSQFRAFYQGNLNTSLAELRRPMICWYSSCFRSCRTTTHRLQRRSWPRGKRSGAFSRIRQSSQRSNSTRATQQRVERR